jgi:hypothetical protein
MGPRPRGRGIGSTISNTGVLTVLQWGRDRAVAELAGGKGIEPRPRHLQWGRDRAVAELWHSFRMTQHLAEGICAFNGAATARSRNWRTIIRNAPRRLLGWDMLQWGRDRAVAEFSSGAKRAEAAGAQLTLQWGRDRAVAEFQQSRIGRRRDAGNVFASMGPRPRGRGIRSPVRCTLARPRRLQWGRDRAVAELKTSDDMTARRQHRRCFNGAATARSRNCSNTWGTCLGERPPLTLQWGRDRAVAELISWLVCLASPRS